MLWGDDEQRIRSFIEQTGVSFPVVVDEGQAAPYDHGWSISPFPLDVVVDRSGIIRLISTEYDAATMQAAVEAAL